MTTLSSAGWVVHDVGLAAAIGGPLFEYTAMTPALEQASILTERDRISVDAAQRFSLVKLASHVSFAVPWIIGRMLRTGDEVSREARALTRAKDVLVGVSLVSGIMGMLAVRRARNQVIAGGDGTRTHDMTPHTIPTKSGPVATLGIVNMLANVGILGITAILAMQGSKSVRFAASSRDLP